METKKKTINIDKILKKVKKNGPKTQITLEIDSFYLEKCREHFNVDKANKEYAGVINLTFEDYLSKRLEALIKWQASGF